MMLCPWRVFTWFLGVFVIGMLRLSDTYFWIVQWFNKFGDDFIQWLVICISLFCLPMFCLVIGGGIVVLVLQNIFESFSHASFYGMFGRPETLSGMIMLPLMWIPLFIECSWILSYSVTRLVSSHLSWRVFWILRLGRDCGLSCLPVDHLDWFLGWNRHWGGEVECGWLF